MKKPTLIRSPLKWAGGKCKVVPELRKHLPKAKCLIEPFVGGGSVFMNTDYDRYALCDSNAALINFYQHMTYNTAALVELAWKFFKAGNTPEAYEGNRKAFNEITLPHDKSRSQYLKWAALFLYLNRHGFNGLYRANLKGEFNVPFGKYDQPYFPYVEMRLFAEKARDTGTRFVCADFRTTIRALTGICPDISFHADKLSDAVIYCDPPYLPLGDKDSFTHYNGKSFTEDDHRALVAHLIKAEQLYGVKSVISNSDTEATRAIYSPFRLHKLNVKRSVSASTEGRKTAPEVIGVLDGRERYVSAPRQEGKAFAAALFQSTTTSPVSTEVF
ncbi:Dam family site-specific DNA-(adenine-N6)-methyltransferase [Salmonella enterica]|nr:Dam family site-specific DNA-(adenine-N6)-methyltransferase [Salmonella enterica]EJJ4373986.1 Dam family site-specific DNA-(adenine-N6)-methyltransferase [Salmonella enterica]EKB5296913.1 Dam family site-specific DNA-(adenine-N6)-methyltransferase [Salmonella enterica]EKC2468864.1 Dam family site-specific DNA-(adenine-N6)-methyltransferase [Salmonella enterica]EKC2480742.1 Dam family site-specific DNA-(adenine-N6)-methyltransferase [Salmonella enterica]